MPYNHVQTITFPFLGNTIDEGADPLNDATIGLIPTAPSPIWANSITPNDDGAGHGVAAAPGSIVPNAPTNGWPWSSQPARTVQNWWQNAVYRWLVWFAKAAASLDAQLATIYAQVNGATGGIPWESVNSPDFVPVTAGVAGITGATNINIGVMKQKTLVTISLPLLVGNSDGTAQLHILSNSIPAAASASGGGAQIYPCDVFKMGIYQRGSLTIVPGSGGSTTYLRLLATLDPHGATTENFSTTSTDQKGFPAQIIQYVAAS